jgi:hypothetical protein
MIPGQIDIDEAIASVETVCDDCPDPGMCRSEAVCSAELDIIEPPENERWDFV